ncbi:hypothetical protein GCM10008986_20290 [Salinibacillus aidingensis]|uniref:DUF4181 domain-containing protein n=1 Tax=Salinibacillus aidingensis TaxID=237684 RepID=A0ABN1BAN3_9BACI
MYMTFLMGVAIAYTLAYLFLRKKFDLPKKPYKEEPPWPEFPEAFFIIFVAVLMFILSGFVWEWDDGLEGTYGLLLLSGLFGFRAFSQWKHNRAQKFHILNFLNSGMALLIFFGFIFISYARDIEYTYEAIYFTEQGRDPEVIEIDFRGEKQRNLLFGYTLEGQWNINDHEFFLYSGRDEFRETPFVDRFNGSNRHYRLHEFNGIRKGELWISRDLQTFAGSFQDSEERVRFAFPADSVHEAEQLFETLPEE